MRFIGDIEEFYFSFFDFYWIGVVEEFIILIIIKFVNDMCMVDLVILILFYFCF